MPSDVEYVLLDYLITWVLRSHPFEKYLPVHLSIYPFLKYFFKLNYEHTVMSVCVLVHVSSGPVESKEGDISSEARVIGRQPWAVQQGCWELNPRPLQGQPMLITAEPHLQSSLLFPLGFYDSYFSSLSSLDGNLLSVINLPRSYILCSLFPLLLVCFALQMFQVPPTLLQMTGNKLY